MQGNENGNQMPDTFDFNWEDDSNTSVVIPTAVSKTKKEKEVLEQLQETEIQIEENESGEKEVSVKPKKDKPTVAEPTEEEVESSIFAEWNDGDGSPKEKETVLKKAKETAAATKVESNNEPAGGGNNEDVDEEEETFTALATDLHARGFFTKPLADGEKIKQDQFFEKADEEIEARVDESLQSFVSELKDDPTANALVKHLRAGGSSAEFFQVYAQSPVNVFPEDYNLEDVKNQRAIVKNYRMTVEGDTEEEAEEEVETLEEKGRLATKAKTYHKKYVEADKEAKEELANRVIADKAARERTAKETRTKLQTALDAADTLHNFKITGADKKTLVPAITAATVKVGKKMVTPLQAKLAEIWADPTKLLALTKYVLDDMKGTDLVKASEKEAIVKVKSTLAQIGKAKNLAGSNRTDKGRGLVDDFK